MNVPTLRIDESVIDQHDTIINSIEFEKGDTLLLFGYDIDKNTTIIISIGIVVSILLWHFTGLFKHIPNNNILFFIFISMILFFISQIFATSFLSGNITLEYSKLVGISQLTSTLLGSLIIFLFMSNQFITQESRKNININMYIIICILMISQVWVNVKTSGTQIKIVRQIKETLFNVSVFTIIANIYIIIKNFS